MTTNPIPVHIREIKRKDLMAVLKIEGGSFACPWEEQDFLRLLRNRCIGMVAEQNGVIVGFVIYSIHETVIRILNLAVDPEFRRRGIGRQIMAKMIGKLYPDRRIRISFIVRETNVKAQIFFRALGFLATGVHREYYRDTGEDAFRMQYDLQVRERAITPRAGP